MAFRFVESDLGKRATRFVDSADSFWSYHACENNENPDY